MWCQRSFPKDGKYFLIFCITLLTYSERYVILAESYREGSQFVQEVLGGEGFYTGHHGQECVLPLYPSYDKLWKAVKSMDRDYIERCVRSSYEVEHAIGILLDNIPKILHDTIGK